MGEKKQKRLYTKVDINKAYSMGLENAVAVMEQSFDHSWAVRWRLIEALKDKIMEDKISAIR